MAIVINSKVHCTFKFKSYPELKKIEMLVEEFVL